MAVKQNNAENSNQVSSAKKQKNSNKNQNTKQTAKNENQIESNQQSKTVKNDANKENNATGESVNNRLTIEMILMCFEMVHKKQAEQSLKETLKYCTDFIQNMAALPEPHAPAEIKQFRENIQKIGHLLKEIASFNPQHKQTYFLKYLKVVCELIATEGFDPCYAIAIVFQLFPDDFILKAVILPLSKYGSDDKIIKKSVRILCDWLRKCTFCSNLNLWILAILSELKKDAEKYDLFTETALIVIEPLTISLIVPILRPKVCPIVFDILMSFKDSPIVFHKILARIPLVLKQLKKECETLSENQEETKRIFHELVDLMSALVENFPNHQELYGSLNEIISQCQKSHEYKSALIGGNASFINENQMDYNNVLISNNPKVGLINLGNTCYMNSVLQALLMTKDFCRDMLLLKPRSPVLLKIQQFFALLLHSSRPELTPSIILQVARPPGFAPGFQQDSSEFLGYFLETLHEHELKSIKAAEMSLEKQNQKMELEQTASKKVEENSCLENSINENDTVDGMQISKEKKAEEAVAVAMDVDEEHLTEEPKKEEIKKVPTTAIDRNFTGKIATTYKCLVCDFESKNIDSFRELQLSFPDQKQISDVMGFASNSTGNTNSYSVQDLLDFYCSTEKLTEDNQYFCEKCKKLCDGERSQSCVIPPTNLILTLKQFKYDQKYNMRAKLMHRIYHNENLSLNIYSPNENVKLETINYCMYAAVVHTGFNMDSGHYYTYARDMTKNTATSSPSSIKESRNENGESNHIWYKFNDNYVTECSEMELQNMNPPNTPYILFYRMQSRNRLDGCRTEYKPPIGPYLEELPTFLRNFIDSDNDEYKAERERYAQPNKIRLTLRSSNNNNNSRKDDDDNNGASGGTNNPPPNCGDNALGNNINNFIY